MEQFVVPLSRFDLGLLPEAARDTASPAFREAVDDYFRRRFREMGVNGVVQLTGDTLTVGWVAPDFDPVAAAIVLCQRGQVRDGVQLLELARSRQPDSPDLLLNLGIGLNELGEGERAVTVLEHLIDLEPDHVRGLVALGVALGRLGEDDAALDRFTRAVVLAPADPWTQSNLGGMLLRVGRPAEARPRLEAAVQLAPKDPRGWLLLGESCLESGDEAAERTALGRARTLDPHGGVRDRAEALLNRVADPAKAHRLEGIPEPLTALQVACLIHASEDALRHALTVSGEMDRWDAVTLGTKDRERLGDALSAVSDLLNPFPSDRPILRFTRTTGLLRQLMDLLWQVAKPPGLA
jgi:Flp pilus assembly protein TadD